MFGYDDMKGWQAVPIVIPSFLIISVATIWYFSFHYFKNRPQYQNCTSPIDSSSRRSGNSDALAGARPPSHLYRFLDVPPVPAPAYSNERQPNIQVQ